MQKTYDAPSWGALPKSNYWIEVLKDGCIISEIKLSEKDHFIFGRNSDICDISLDHPSISRQHAVLQFRDDGAPMLLDMGSAQGTLLNKKRCIQNVYQRLYVGDILRFGASSRQYILNGPQEDMPAEYDSANMQKYREQIVKKSNDTKKDVQQSISMGISWGFSEDAENVDEVEENEPEQLPDYVKYDPNYDRKYGDKYSVTIKESEVNEKDKEILEKIKIKERKIHNMQEENRRIYMKEASQDHVLTEGQNAAVNRNDARITQLSEEIEELEASIRDKNHYRQGDNNVACRAGLKTGSRHEKDNDDDILDITDTTADATTNWRLRKKLGKKSKVPSSGSGSSSVALTYEDLTRQRDELQTALTSLRMKIQHCKTDIDNFSQLVSEATIDVVDDANADEMERIIRTGRLQEATETLRSLIKQETEEVDKLARTERLVRVATPALSSLKSNSSSSNSTSTSSAHVTVTKNVPLMDASASIHQDRDIVIPDPESEYSLPRDKDVSVPRLSPNKIELTGKEGLTAEISDDTIHETNGSDPVVMGMDSKNLPYNDEISSNDSKSKKRPISLLSATMTPDIHKELEQQKLLQTLRETTEGGDDFDDVSPPYVDMDETDGVEQQKKQRGDRGKKDKGKRVVGPNRPPDKYLIMKTGTVSSTTTTTTTNAKVLEGGDIVWTPPCNQKGDGRTNLNEKLGY